MGSGEEIGGSVVTDEQLIKTQALALPSELASPNDFLFAEKKVCLYFLKHLIITNLISILRLG